MHLEPWLHDFRLAARGFRRAKVFHVGAALTLAIGMAGATVMFALIHGILLRPLPIPDEDRLVVSWRTPPSGLATHIPYGAADVEEIARASQLFERVTGVGYNGAFEISGSTPAPSSPRERRRSWGSSSTWSVSSPSWAACSPAMTIGQARKRSSCCPMARGSGCSADRAMSSGDR